jgi:ribosomal protein L37AE/L43A
MTVISLDEHRANREADADLDYTPLPTEQALPHARKILSLLEGVDHVEPDHGAGQCTSCETEVPVRFTYGPMWICRTCRRARLRAAAQADMPLPADQPQHPGQT